MAEDNTGLVIEGSAIQALMVKAILETWTPEQRDALISDAVATMFHKTSVTMYGRDKTVIEVALADGAKKAATQVIEDLMQTPEYVGRLKAVVQQEFDKLLEDPEDGKGPIRRGIAEGIRVMISDKSRW